MTREASDMQYSPTRTNANRKLTRMARHGPTRSGPECDRPRKGTAVHVWARLGRDCLCGTCGGPTNINTTTQPQPSNNQATPPATTQRQCGEKLTTSQRQPNDNPLGCPWIVVALLLRCRWPVAGASQGRRWPVARLTLRDVFGFLHTF